MESVDIRKIKLTAKRSDGQTFEYQNDTWVIQELEGLDFPGIEISRVNRGSGNGSIITGKRKTERPVDITARSKQWWTNVQDREQAIAFHNSNYTYDLEITYMDKTRIAKNCELEGAKCPMGQMWLPLDLTISFLCPDADLYADNTSETDFLSVDPLWHVTRVYTQGGGTLAFGVINRSTEKVITYYGSETAPIIATVTATGLVEGVNVSIGDVKVSADCTLTEGDVFVLNSETRLITINGVKVAESKYNYNDLPDLLMQYGDNIVKISADDEGNIAFDANIEFVGRYGGL